MYKQQFCEISFSMIIVSVEEIIGGEDATI